MANIRQNEEDRREASHQANMDARRRRLESQNLTALTDPGRYAPQVYKQAKQWHDEKGLRDHELRMLEKQGENEFKVAEQKRFGMKEKGADAAAANAEATKYGWDKQLEVEQERQKGGLTLAEKQIASQERIAGMEHGTIGPDGKVTPGSRERVAGINADAVAQQAELKRQHELEIEREKTQRNTDTNQAQLGAAVAQQQRADKNAASRVDQDVMQGKYLESGMTPDKWKNMTEEERSAFRKIVGVNPQTEGNQPPARRNWRDRYGTAD